MDAELSTWWVLRDGGRAGPYSRSQLQAMASRGDIDAADKLWKDGLAAPVHVADVHGLMPKAQPLAASVNLAAPVDIGAVNDVALPLTAGSPVEGPSRLFLKIVFLTVTLLFFCGVGGICLFIAIAQHQAAPLIVVGIAFMMPVLLVYGIIKTRQTRASRRKLAAGAGFEYTEAPPDKFGADIVAGSVLMRDKYNSAKFGLLRGQRHDSFFQAIDCTYNVGKGFFSQSVVAVRLRHDNPVPFAIVDSYLQDDCKALGRVPLASQPFGLHEDQLFVASPYQKSVPVSNEFLQVFCRREGANVEVMRDHLLVYRLRKLLRSDDYLEWIDFALALEAQLEHRPGVADADIANAGEPETKPPEADGPATVGQVLTGIVILLAILGGVGWAVARYFSSASQLVELLLAAVAINIGWHLWRRHTHHEDHLDLFVRVSMYALPVALVALVWAWLAGS